MERSFEGVITLDIYGLSDFHTIYGTIIIYFEDLLQIMVQKIVADWQGAGSATDAAVLFATVAPATLATWTHGWTPGNRNGTFALNH